MIVTLSSVGGSPGVTSWSLLLAAGWPDVSTERIVLEADTAGGVLGARYGFGVDPGAAALIASCRRGSGLDVSIAGRVVADGVRAVPSPELTESAQPFWVAGADALVPALADDPRTWFIDLGRLDLASPVRDFAAVANLNLVVVGPHLEHLVRVPSRVKALSGSATAVGVLVLGASGYGTGQLTEFFGADQVWCEPAVPDLPRAVSRVIQRSRSRRHQVWRSARVVASDATRLANDTAVRRAPLFVGGQR